MARWTFRDDAAAAAGPSALLLELSSWIEEAQLLGPLGAGATLYMEHSSEVNDTAGAEEGAAPGSQLVTVWGSSPATDQGAKSHFCAAFAT